MPRRLLWAVAGVLVWPMAAAAQFPVGPEFVVNSVTTYAQARPSVFCWDGNLFFATWENYAPGPPNSDITGRYHFASGGTSTELTVNTFTTGTQYRTRVAADRVGGDFMVVWESNEPEANWNVFARRYSFFSTPQGDGFRVNTFTTGDQRSAAVSADATGNFVVVWQSAAQDGSDLGVFAQRFDAVGAPLGGEFRVNALTAGRQANPSVAWQGTTSFVVAWEGEDGGPGSVGIRARRFDPSGAPIGSEFSVNTYTFATQARPAVAADAAGNFVITWTSSHQETGTADVGIYAQRFDAAGARLGGEFHVNTYTTGGQDYPAVAMDETGDFVVAWHSQGEDGDFLGVFARRYHSSGVPEGGAFQVNEYTTQAQAFPSVSAGVNGDFVVAWHSPQDGGGAAVVARRFRPDLLFMDGFESGTSSAWSSIADDGGDLTVSPAAAMGASTRGLQGVVDDTAGLYVQDDSPETEKHYRARFYFDTNGYDPGESLNHRRTRMFIAFGFPNSRRVAAVVLRRLNGSYSVMARARLDDNTQANTSFIPISDGPHTIQIRLAAATGPDTNDGALALYVDGPQVDQIDNLDNSLAAVELVRLGALSVKTGANGTLFWDEFHSRRFGVIP